MLGKSIEQIIEVGDPDMDRRDSNPIDKFLKRKSKI